MKRTLLALLVGLVIGFIVSTLLRPRLSFTQVETAVELNSPVVSKFIANRISKIEYLDPDGTIRHFKPSGQSLPNQTVVLETGKPFTIPDHHGMTQLLVIGVDQNKATIAYTTQFSHLSFGENRVSVNCGVVQIDVVGLPNKMPDQTKPEAAISSDETLQDE